MSHKVPSVLPVSGPVTLAVETPKVPKEWKPKAIPAVSVLQKLKSIKVVAVADLVPLSDEQIANRSEAANVKAQRDIAVYMASGIDPALAQDVANSRTKSYLAIGSGPKALKASPGSRIGKLALALALDAQARKVGA